MWPGYQSACVNIAKHHAHWKTPARCPCACPCISYTSQCGHSIRANTSPESVRISAMSRCYGECRRERVVLLVQVKPGPAPEVPSLYGERISSRTGPPSAFRTRVTTRSLPLYAVAISDAECPTASNEP